MMAAIELRSLMNVGPAVERYEKTPWFAWTAERKRRVAAGELDLGGDA